MGIGRRDTKMVGVVSREVGKVPKPGEIVLVKTVPEENKWRGRKVPDNPSELKSGRGSKILIGINFYIV